MDVPTIEQPGDAVDTSSDSGKQAIGIDAGGASGAGPSVTFSYSDGTVTLGQEDLRLLFTGIQTLILLWMTYREVQRR